MFVRGSSTRWRGVRVRFCLGTSISASGLFDIDPRETDFESNMWFFAPFGVLLVTGTLPTPKRSGLCMLIALQVQLAFQVEASFVTRKHGRSSEEIRAVLMTLWPRGVVGCRYQQILNSSFSIVSNSIFARLSKSSLESFWRDLQYLYIFAPLRPQKYQRKFVLLLLFSDWLFLKVNCFSKCCHLFAQVWWNSVRISRNLNVSYHRGQ